MTQKILVNIDLNKNELQNARIQNLATAPANPVTGQVYYDTTLATARIFNGTVWANIDPAKAEGIPLTALAGDVLNRASHTGSQLAATISDFNAAVRSNPINTLATPTAEFSMGGFRITGLGAPQGPSDAANRQYVDDAVAGLAWKDEIDVATTQNITLSGVQNIDSFDVTEGMRVLVKDQAVASNNGIYVVATGTWTRAVDADTGPKISGSAAFVKHGAQYGGQRFVCNVSGTILLGTTAITFVPFGGGQSYTGGDGITLNTNQFSVRATPNGGVLVDGTGVSIDRSKVPVKFSAFVGDGSQTSVVVTHNLNSQDVHVTVMEAATRAVVWCDVIATSSNTVTLGFTSAPAANSLRCVVIG